MNPTVRVRRRWFQFTLRGALVFTALVATVTAWIAHERKLSRQEAPTAEMLRSQGAFVAYVGPFLLPEDYSPSAKSGRAPAWWRRALSDVCGPRIRAYHWTNNSTTNDVVHFESRQAKYFDFSSYPSINLTPLVGLALLDDVGVHFRSAQDLSPLAELKRLRSLNLSFTGASDLTPLAALTRLESLDLTYTRASDLSPLARLTRLKRLDLSYAALVRDISPLAGLQNLESLDLRKTHVVDVTPLAQLTKLESLDLSSTPVSDLSALAGMKKLKQLNLRGSQVDEREARRMQNLLPDCTFDADYPPPKP